MRIDKLSGLELFYPNHVLISWKYWPMKVKIFKIGKFVSKLIYFPLNSKKLLIRINSIQSPKIVPGIL